MARRDADSYADQEATLDDLDGLPPPELPPPYIPPSTSADGQQAVRALIARGFFGTAAAIGLASALTFVFMPQDLAFTARVAIVGGLVVFALIALAALRVPRERIETTMLLVVLGAIAIITGAALLLGWGLAAPGLGFFALLVCMACALASRLAGWVSAAAGALALALLAVLPAAAGMGGAALDQQLLWLVVHALLLLAGLAGGMMIAGVLGRYVRRAAEREQRFRGLLSIAADAYWEIDHQYRLVSATLPRDEGLVLETGHGDGAGELPWELPQFVCDAETLDQLQADLDARHAFRDLPVGWRGSRGQVRQLLVSGEPRIDERGVFRGFWGVARDVSADHGARQMLAATETRFQELFVRIPTPLVLHRRGRIVDANPAALALFGHAKLEGMLDHELISFFDEGESRERARQRIEQLEHLPVGEALPVAEFRLTSRDGRRCVARATGVRVDSDGAPATLSIFADDTERKAAEEAVRRSEAMLSHLVGSSPDVITLSEMQTGRYVRVNQTFERTMGWRADEVVGRTAFDVGLWHRIEDRERLVAQLRERERVTGMPAQFVTREGQVISMLLSAARFRLDQRDYLIINGRDVSVAESARLEREAILDNTSIGIAVTRDRRFVMANPAFEQMYGWPLGTLVGQPGRAVWTSDEDYAEVGRIAGPALARGESVELDRPAQRRDGSGFLARIVGKAIDPSHPAKGGTIWIIEDVTAHRQVAEALARARDEAEAASRAKSTFLANTSHELRTPLNGMLGLAQLARAPDLDEGRRRVYLDQIVDSAQSLAEILSDILDLAKIEAGRLQTDDHPFDLDALLQSLQRAYTTLADARGLALQLELSGDGALGMVRGDALRVRQILSNLLTNALKFTEQGSVRLLAHRLDATRVRFEVHDTGPGIELAVQQRLFRPFTQADDSTTRRFGGTGLGLSICRELAHLMHGEVGVISRPGEGACFWAELALPVVVGWTARLPAASGDALAPLAARVLLAEDNPVNLMIAAAMLERWGLQVEQAVDGAQAVAAVRAAAQAGRPFDLVLMDLQMPVMGGYEATRALRADYPAAELPIIALTAAATVSEREQALAAGMSEFLTKPIDADRLRETIGRVLAQRATAPPTA